MIEQLRSGERPGDRIIGFPDYFVYKVRVKNSDLRKGKSSGYRVIYQSLMSNKVVLLYVYIKSDQDNVTVNEIYAVIESFKADLE